jgi:hypothetical protein
MVVMGASEPMSAKNFRYPESVQAIRIRMSQPRLSAKGILLLLVLALTGSAFWPQPAYALPACPNPITNCGCAVTSPGTYGTGSNLTASSGDCIDVETSNVTLALSLYELTGPGVKGGVGIRVDAPGVIILGTDISEFGTGILINAPRVSFVAGIVESNVGDGVVIRAPETYIQGVLIQNNGGRGIVDTFPSRVTMFSPVVQGNGGNGIEFDGSTIPGLICGKPALVPGTVGGGLLALLGNIFTGSAAGTIGSSGLAGLPGGILVLGVESYSNGGNGLAFNGVSGVSLVQEQGAGIQAYQNHLNGLQFTSVSGLTLSGVFAHQNQGDGIQLTAVNGASLVDVNASSNTGDGVEFTQVQGASVSASQISPPNNIANDNGGHGYDIQTSCLDSLSNLTASDNFGSGIYMASNNGNGVSLSNADSNSYYGIEIQKGEGGDQVLSSEASVNSLLDAIDQNPSCGTDYWLANTFGTSVPPCVDSQIF